MSDIKKYIVEYICDNYGAKAYEVETETLKKFMDSLDALEMLMILEKKYNVSIEDELTQEWKTVDDVVATIEELLNKDII